MEPGKNGLSLLVDPGSPMRQKTKSKSNLRLAFSGKSGLTLVEVVASTVLLATVLVAMMIAFRVHQRQVVRADELNRAVAAIDSLLSDWYSSTERFPEFPDMGKSLLYPELIWRADLIDRQQPLEFVPLGVVRIGIYSMESPTVEITHCDIVIAELNELSF